MHSLLNTTAEETQRLGFLVCKRIRLKIQPTATTYSLFSLWVMASVSTHMGLEHNIMLFDYMQSASVWNFILQYIWFFIFI